MKAQCSQQSVTSIENVDDTLVLLLDATVNLPPTLSKSQVSSVRKNLKMQMLSLLRLPAASEFRYNITTLLTDLGATQSEVSSSLVVIVSSRYYVGVLLHFYFFALTSKELEERLGIDDIALVLQQNRLRWCGHVLRKEDDDWVKKCMEYEVEGRRPRGRPKRTWREVVKEECQAHKLNTEDAMDRSKWRKLIKDVQ